MTRLNHCSRIAGGTTETRRYARSRAIAASLVVSFAVLAMSGTDSIAPIGLVFAQTPGTAGPISLGELFENDGSIDPTAEGTRRFSDAAQKARDQGNCPKGTITVVVKKGDPIFQQAIASGRRDVLARTLGDQARNFVFETDPNGTKSDVRMDYGVPRDDIAPKLDVTWTPPKGSKVKAGGKIKAKVIAHDDTNLWQSGVKTIDLTVQGGGSFGFGDYPQPPRTCEGPPPAQTLEGVYTVPANPPALVRLHAIAKDYAGNEIDVWAEFPTGDWVGAFKWKHICEGGGNRDETHGISDLALDYDGRGNLTGTLTGSTPQREQTIPPCTFAYVAPGTFSANLLGSYTPSSDTFSVQATNVQTTPGRASFTCPAGTSEVDLAFFSAFEGPMFRDAFRGLRRQPGGSLKLIPDGTYPHPTVSGTTCTTTYSLTLNPARN